MIFIKILVYGIWIGILALVITMGPIAWISVFIISYILASRERDEKLKRLSQQLSEL